MGIEIKSDDGYCQARIEGDMTIYTAGEYRETLLTQCHSRGGLELDLEHVSEIDTAGLQLLIALKKHLDDTESGLQIKKYSEAVQKALVLTQLETAFNDRIGETEK
ncbi:MAG: STAS domain-containing protein [Gammaproteobacteria bacterium]|nr:STAS domain-containing protein [Gammaproteobacteria bacterium]